MTTQEQLNQKASRELTFEDEAIYMDVVASLPSDASFEELVEALRLAGFFERRKWKVTLPVGVRHKLH